MSFAFDRRSHDDASQHAEAILGRLQANDALRRPPGRRRRPMSSPAGAAAGKPV